MANTAVFGQFRIFPRGFLGSMQAPMLVSQAKKGDMLTTSGLSAILDANESSVITANRAIEELYTKLMRMDLAVNDFNFCDTVYKEVFKAFGTGDFEGWYMAQFQSPAFGELHRDFLDDCLRFITTGTRRMQLVTWDAIITTDDAKIKSQDLSENARFYFGKRTIRDLAPSGRNTMPEVVQSWIKKPSGINDLLYTAHILFGLARP